MSTKQNRRDFLRLGATAGTGLACGSMGLSGCTSLQTNGQQTFTVQPVTWAAVEEESGVSKSDLVEKLLGRTLLHAPDVPDYSAWIENADHHCRHEFNLLGSGWVRVYHGMQAPGWEGNNYSDPSITFDQAFQELPNSWKPQARRMFDTIKALKPDYVPIDWQIDFKSGLRYSVGTHHASVKYGVTPGVDAKVPSALGRSFRLVTLAMAYQAQKDERYAVEIICQILDWMAMNPPGRGAGWRGVMNVGIRISNWVVAVNLIRDYLMNNKQKPAIDFFLRYYLASLEAHGQFLMNNLELPEKSIHPNHYIANISGLLVLGAATEGIFKASGNWANFAMREMVRETRSQIMNDGVDFEGATAYTAFAFEMFTYAGLIAANAATEGQPVDYLAFLKQNFGDAYVAKLEKMSFFLANLHKPSGLIPLAGDYDSGRFLKLEPPTIDSIDRRSQAFLGAVLFGTTLQVPEAHTFVARLLLGNRLVDDKHKIAGPALTSQAFTDAGFYIMRNQQDQCFILCGPIGTGGLGGHAHNDKLAFELTAKGKEIFIDPGVYVYTASLDWRNQSRATRNHNTLMIAGQEQNRFATDSKWWGCLEETRCQCLTWETKPNADLFIGEHRGYEKLTPPIVHRRTITFDKKNHQLAIADKLKTDQTSTPTMPELEWNFMLHPDCKATQQPNGSFVITNGDVKAKFTIGAGKAVIGEGWYCPAYGVKLAAQRITVTSPFIAENTFLVTW